MPDTDLICDLVIDAVVEWLGLKYRKSQIKAELTEINGGKPLNPWAYNAIIKAATQKIRDIYHIDAVESKGSSIEFYSAIIRKPKIAIKYKLIAQQRLDALLGLEHLATDDPKIYAEKVARAMKAMDASVDGTAKDDETDSKSDDLSAEVSDSKSDDLSDEMSNSKLAEGLKDIELDNSGYSLKSK